MEPLNLKTLIRKRGCVKSKVTCFSKYLDTIETTFNTEKKLDGKQVVELQLRVDQLDNVVQEFDDLQMNIEVLCEENDFDQQLQERSDFTDNINKYLSSAKYILQQCYESSPPDNNSDNSSRHSSYHNSNELNVRLPPINLPQFTGDINSWMEFKDTFESLIHNNDSIGDIQKYHYLRASLGSDALKVIQSLEFSSQNYKIAWDLLCTRFDNSRILVNSHIKALFNLSPLTRESSEGLRDLLDEVNKHLRSLTILNLPTMHWDALLIYMISSKFDKTSAREWEKVKVNGENLPTMDDLRKFLKNRADFLATFENSQRDSREKDVKKGNRQVSLFSENANNKRKCNFCDSPSHAIYSCEQFLNLTVPLRWKKITDLKLCTNCLCKGHFNKQCRLGSCKKCNLKHSSLLHGDHHQKSSSSTQQVNSQATISQGSVVESVQEGNKVCNDNQQTGNTSVTLSSRTNNNLVLLSTAIVRALDSSGNFHNVRAILDSGSQSCFISEQLCKKLGLKTKTVNMSISGLSNLSTCLKLKCDISIKSIHTPFDTTISCYVVPSIADNLPALNINVASWKIPHNLPLADPQFNLSDSVDLLIGASLFYNLLLDERFSLGKHMPVLQNTVLGYVVSGEVPLDVPKLQSYLVTNQMLHDDLQRFWTIEELKEVSIPTDDDVLCEKHFIENVSRDDSGKFVVRLPLKHPVSDLGDSNSLALKRLHSLERRFQKDSSFKKQYCSFMAEYQKLGHMSPISDVDYQTCYFLPHHGVQREESLTTKLRVVFDGSAVTSSGKSLNDIQFVGPSIQNNIVDILLRFRQHEVVVTSDIEKMYRCIWIHPDDRHLQQIFWRSDPEQPIGSYQLNTVTYGTASAPYLAIRCIKQLSMDNKVDFPESSEIISNDFYVDDLITGFENEASAIKRCKEISDILLTASFKLRKWKSNSSKVLDHLRDDSDNLSILNLSDNDLSKTLGIQWICSTDMLCFRLTNSVKGEVIPTKRTILSCIAKIFDPLGLLSPTIILLKILIQKIWSIKLDWDDQLPADLQQIWNKFKLQLTEFNNLNIPRHVLCQSAILLELHGFCDASQSAYCAAVYLRSVDKYQNVHVQLLCAKTKVAPVKVLTVPRLELCGALLLARLTKTVINSFKRDIKLFLWCDSQIVLYWINSQPNSLQTFVANRVSQIRSSTDPKDWKYINTRENPSDVATRGIYPQELIKCNLWWYGPGFFKDDGNWPEPLQFSQSFKIPEMKNQNKVFTAIDNNDFSIIHRFSRLNKLKRVYAYIRRFVSNSRKPKGTRECGSLKVYELESSMTNLIRLAQLESFHDEIKILKSNQSLKNKHRLQSLNPFLDSDGLIRVGGRLKNSDLPFDSKHPILLSGRHKLTTLIFEEEHLKLFHAGPQLLLASIRRKYWPTSGICVSKSIVRRCLKCFRHKPRFTQSVMADLPAQRVTISNPFSITGIDYAGPFILKDRKGRGCKTYKAYCCLFICFASKAVHLELVTDLTTENFIATLRRFSSRRGVPIHIYSDNATNFVGAQRELQSLYQFLINSESDIIRRCADDGIVWHFIPPNSPTFGGLWESNIKGVKYHLSRVIGETILIYEEFHTLLVQIEAILNSRPLYPLSADPNDLEPLTPAHFIIGKPLTAVPEPAFQESTRLNQLSRLQLIQKMKQGFWKQWSKLYLNQLQQRKKWKSSSENISVGQLVLIKNDNLPPCKWLLGRVLAVHPGSDGVVRVVTLKTLNGTLTRAVSKICPLPMVA